MVTVRDMRIGDFISYNNQRWVIKGIEQDQLKLESHGVLKNVSPEEVNPIPLTAELMFEIGFEASEQECQHGKPYREFNYKGVVINLFLLNEPVFLYCPDDTFEGNAVSYSRPPLKFLHQLQNLFYILTGKELEIN